jgi:ParB-like chromosome segregation protein Spo0J
MTDAVQANIAAGLQDLVVPVSQLNLHPQNYRQGDVETIVASITRFGQVRPLVVQESTMNVVAGNHTLKAITQLGWAECAAVLVELSDEEAEAYLVADNRASDKATNDDAALAAILERMMLAGKLEGTGYTPDEVDDLMATMNALPEGDVETDAEHGVEDEALRERFANRSQVALRQFVLMYPAEVAEEVEAQWKRLARAWGVSGMREVVREALDRALREPPVEGLTDEERARADAPEPTAVPDDTTEQPGGEAA